MIGVRVASVGVLAPGLPDWPHASAVLTGRARYVPDAMPDPIPALLPANERRRASISVRWALAAGCEALAASGRSADEVATVFASCGGDGAITHQICEALATATRDISPTRFHNSVHNAPAGYWSIATRSHAPSTSLCGYRATFAVGLLEAMAQVAHDGAAVLLIAYDIPYPAPMQALWPVSQPFAAALMLEPAGALGAHFQVEVRPSDARSAWPAMLPERLADNPAAHALPLLAALARHEACTVSLPYLEGSHIAVKVTA
jgi:hypothetical protein